MRPPPKGPRPPRGPAPPPRAKKAGRGGCARRSRRDPCARRTPGDARGRTVPTPRRRRASGNSSRRVEKRRGGAWTWGGLGDPLGPDDIAGQPVGALRPVVAVVLDAGLQRDDVLPGGSRHREVGRRDLEYLAHLIRIALTEAVFEDDLVPVTQVGQAVEDAVAHRAGVAETVAGYVGVGPRYPREAGPRHVTDALRQYRLGGALQHRDVVEPDRGYGQIHGRVRGDGGRRYRFVLSPRLGPPVGCATLRHNRPLGRLLRGRLPGARYVGSFDLLGRLRRRFGGSHPTHRLV